MEEKLNSREGKKPQGILPASGIWTVQGLADWLGTSPGAVQQKLSDNGVRVISFSNRYKQRLFRLEDLRAGDGK